MVTRRNVLTLAVAVAALVGIIFLIDNSASGSHPAAAAQAPQPVGGPVVVQTPSGGQPSYGAPVSAAAAGAAKKTPTPSSTPPGGATPTPSVPDNLGAVASPTQTVIGPPGPDRKVKVTNPDGCDHAYGTTGQCIPITQPNGKPITCAFLQQQGFFATPLVVTGDPVGLMKKPHVQMSTDAQGRMVVTGCSDS